MRHFWDAAGALDPKAREMDEGRRFSLCKPEPLGRLFLSAGLEDVQVRAIEVPTYFRDFDDYWSPFLSGQGPAPSYAMSLQRFAVILDHAVSWRHGCVLRRPMWKTTSRQKCNSKEHAYRANFTATRYRYSLFDRPLPKLGPL